MNPLRSLQHFETPTCILQHQKLNLCSKTDISETAWINAYQDIQVFVFLTIP